MEKFYKFHGSITDETFTAPEDWPKNKQILLS